MKAVYCSLAYCAASLLEVALYEFLVHWLIVADCYCSFKEIGLVPSFSVIGKTCNS